MKNDLDAALRRLAMPTDHPGLVGLENTVIARIHARDRPLSGLSVGVLPAGGLAVAGAVALGILAAGPGQSPATAASPAPFGAVSALAPSTLLLADR